MSQMKMFQVSTLQALMLGYSRPVISVNELLSHGNTGLGTFTDVDGEMIVLDGTCYRATENGDVVIAEPERGVPFSAVCNMEESNPAEFGRMENVGELKTELNNIIDSHFGLNSMHMVRIDGEFEFVDARSESGYTSNHISLKDILGKTQKAFKFENIKGTLVCVYFPDFMDGINAAGWHLHFISDDKKHGGHVFEIVMKSGSGLISKINSIEIKLPDEPVFDTYSLKQASDNEIKEVEQGKG
ncbi:acetolactate decarboxylase [Butyrivibrio sp. AC2005]|uniref:acetolactate decarboxylase n=1 Tax=Butyrivibrio sp. AC2005 TaxID=1280672 RepID=UPI0003F9B278|nr:acetolactate decarboxylase [Butyrivibrio sp. AC2005]